MTRATSSRNGSMKEMATAHGQQPTELRGLIVADGLRVRF
jgi:hypothetical protein